MSNFLFGNFQQKSVVQNKIFMVAKQYIYRSKCLTETLYIRKLINDIKIFINVEKCIAKKQNSLEEFNIMWQDWTFLLSN